MGFSEQCSKNNIIFRHIGIQSRCRNKNILITMVGPTICMTKAAVGPIPSQLGFSANWKMSSSLAVSFSD